MYLQMIDQQEGSAKKVLLNRNCEEIEVMRGTPKHR